MLSEVNIKNRKKEPHCQTMPSGSSPFLLGMATTQHCKNHRNQICRQETSEKSTVSTCQTWSWWGSLAGPLSPRRSSGSPCRSQAIQGTGLFRWGTSGGPHMELGESKQQNSGKQMTKIQVRSCSMTRYTCPLQAALSWCTIAFMHYYFLCVKNNQKQMKYTRLEETACLV